MLVEDARGAPLAELVGDWQPDLRRAFDVVDGDFLVALGELLAHVERGDLTRARTVAHSMLDRVPVDDTDPGTGTAGR